MCLRLLKRSAQDTLHRWNAICVTTVRITSHVLFHLFWARIRRCRRRKADYNLRRDSRRWCLQPELLLWQTLRDGSLLLAAVIWGRGKREGVVGGVGERERALVSLMEREGSEIRSHLRAGEEEQLFLIIRERLFLPQREGWLAGTCPRGRFYVPACVWRGRVKGEGEGILTKIRNIRLSQLLSGPIRYHSLVNGIYWFHSV